MDSLCSIPVVCILQFIVYIKCVCASSVTVDSPFGRIQGKVTGTGWDNDDESLVVFSNIPYAKPPVGELRFAKSEPHPKIDGIFDATNQRSIICPITEAYLFGSEQGNEDCLVLTIYAKNNINPNPTALKKVMVFIHGGGFICESGGFYNLTSFTTTHDVISVTFNYRLGILGFLSLGNEVARGNYGLWDQVTALQWVKDNIKAFGGDPDDITISGESAGGASAGYLSISPVTKGLFSRAYLASGAATSVFAQDIEVQKHALKFAKVANCWDGEITDVLDLSQSKAVMNCLRNVDQSIYTSYMYYSITDAQFAPTADGELVPRRPLLLLNDDLYLESIGFYERSYLVSIVNNEFALSKYLYEAEIGMVLGNDQISDENKNELVLKIAKDIKTSNLHSRLNRREPSSSSLVENVMDFYTRRMVEKDAVVGMADDLSYLIPAYDFLDAVSRQNTSKSWFLYFNHFPHFQKGQFKGSVHAADVLFWHDLRVADLAKMFNIGLEGKMDGEDFRLKSLFSSVIAEFVKHGDPGLALEEMLPFGWPPYDSNSSFYLNFNLKPTLRSHLKQENRDLWLEKVPEWDDCAHEQIDL